MRHLKLNSKHTEQASCIICGRAFIRSTGKSRSGAFVTKYTRGKNALACSKKCSKDFLRIYGNLRPRILNRQNGKLKKTKCVVCERLGPPPIFYTCSPKCHKVFSRVHTHLINKMKGGKRDEKNKKG